MKHLKSFLFLGLLVTSCFSSDKTPDDDWVNTLDASLQSRLEDARQYNFLPPDTLEKNLFIATYYELHNERGGHSIIMYVDSTKTAARRLTYIDKILVDEDKLQKIKEDQFTSAFDKAEYIIKPLSVAYIKTNGNTSVSFDNPRIDKNAH